MLSELLSLRRETDHLRAMVSQSTLTFSGGNVGIGKVPTCKLDVAGDCKVGGFSYLNNPVVAYTLFGLLVADVNRWTFGKNDSAEGGANAGSNFDVYRYSDAGAYLGRPININRASGDVSLDNSLMVNVNVGINTTAPKAKLHVVGLVDYANNAAAITAGLTAGAFYTETGTNPKRVCVVY